MPGLAASKQLLARSPSLLSHTGTWLMREIVEPHGLTVTEVAEHLGVSRQNMSALLKAGPRSRR